MSELKDRWFWAYPTESVDCDGITGSANEVYSKSDVDKVIAELRAQIVQADAGYDKALKEKLVEYATLREWAELQLRHQKYKRCIAMANYWVAVSYQCADDKHRRNAERRHRKWLELAGEFEEEFK